MSLFRDIVGTENMAMIVDVRTCEFKGSQRPLIVENGWTVVPIFKKFQNKLYVRNGYYQVPLIRGPVDKDLIEEIRKFNDPSDFLKDKIKKR